MQSENARAVDNCEVLGILLDDIPALNLFIPTGELDARPHVSTGPPNGDDPEWVRAVWHCVAAVSARCGIRPLIAELAVVQDPRALNGEKPYFVSSIVCGEEVAGPAGGTPILDAYLSMIGEVEHLGTSVQDDEFHREKHYVHIPARGAAPDVPRHSHATGTSAIRRRLPCAGEKWKSSGVTLLEHCQQFFHHFLRLLGEHCWRFARGEYIAIPFQRPERFTGDLQGDTTGRRLEPGGVMFLIIDPQNPDPKQRLQDIDTFVTRMRLVINEACKKESSLSLDLRIADAVAREQKLTAYDGIGHTLRAYVEATGYDGAANRLRAVLRRTDLPDEVRQSVTYALRSLSFFGHAEGLGSLMRLHGWVNERHQDPTWPLAAKVLRCYDETRVEEVRRGERTDEVLMGYLRMVEAQAAILATKDRVPFRI
ncbi:MAG: hypothetical protein ACKODX_20930, partial [Gemmata sp.]